MSKAARKFWVPSSVALDGGVERLLPGMAKGAVTDVMPECDCLDEVFVDPDCPADSPRDLRDLERVSETGAVVVAVGVDEYLGFVFQAPECLLVQNPVPIPLKAGPHRVFRLIALPSNRIRG